MLATVVTVEEGVRERLVVLMLVDRREGDKRSDKQGL
jgi:hypothetical protein